jgi:solute carrier family 25 uncoupling protein 8/9
LTALWKGLGPNVARNAIINAAELASYDEIKQVRITFLGGVTVKVILVLLSITVDSSFDESIK